jgi:hypothetical protein
VAGRLAGGKQHRDATGQHARDHDAEPGRNGRARAVSSDSYQRIWYAEVPSRNPNFTGRATELETLPANLIFRGRPVPPAQVISGMGGVGKTEIATEYIHRHPSVPLRPLVSRAAENDPKGRRYLLHMGGMQGPRPMLC